MNLQHKYRLPLFLFITFGGANLIIESLVYCGLSHAPSISILTMLMFVGIFYASVCLYDINISNIPTPWRRGYAKVICESIFFIIISFSILIMCMKKIGVLEEYYEFISNKWGVLSAAIYIASAVFQEQVFRGYFSGFLEENYLRETSPITKIILASVIFSITHEVWGVPIMWFTFFSNIILHAIYLRQKSLLGVTLIHIFYGLLFFPYFFQLFRPW